MSVPVPGLILVRSTSTRLPHKCFLPFGEGSVLEHIAVRALHFDFEPIICTTDEAADDTIYELAQRNRWKVFRGSTEDKIKRLRDACDYYHIEDFITIDADDPFFDPEMDHKSFGLLGQGYDFVLPPENYYTGSVGFSIKKWLLDKAVKECDTSNSEMMWKILSTLDARMITLKADDDRMLNIRLTLDYEEDYHLLLTVLRLLGPFTSGNDIEKLFARNPDLYKVNWFRQEQWQEHQDKS